jgi:membrane protein implicated in regulation of membrane protease activity
MKSIKTWFLYVIILLFYLILIPEIVFRYLPEKYLLFLGKIANPFHLMSSSLDSLIIAIVVVSVALAWLTLFLIRRLKVYSRK